jgi:hypothetical protein
MPKKLQASIKKSLPQSDKQPPPPEPDELVGRGVAPSRTDMEEELSDMHIDPFYAETAYYGRNADDPQGGIGLNFGDW